MGSKCLTKIGEEEDTLDPYNRNNLNRNSKGHLVYITGTEIISEDG